MPLLTAPHQHRPPRARPRAGCTREPQHPPGSPMASQHPAGLLHRIPSCCLPARRPRARVTDWAQLWLLLSGRGVCLQKGPWLSRDTGSASSSAARRWGNFLWEDSAGTCCSLCADSALYLWHVKGLGPWSPTGACLGLQPQTGQSQQLPSPQFLLVWEGRMQHPQDWRDLPYPVGSLIHKSRREQKVLLSLDSPAAGLGLCPAWIHGASVHWGVGTSPLSLMSNNSCLSLAS